MARFAGSLAPESGRRVIAQMETGTRNKFWNTEQIIRINITHVDA